MRSTGVRSAGVSERAAQMAAGHFGHRSAGEPPKVASVHRGRATSETDADELRADERAVTARDPTKNLMKVYVSKLQAKVGFV